MKRWSTDRAASAVDPRNLAQGTNCEAAADDAIERDSSGQSSLIVVQADRVCIVGTESCIRRCPGIVLSLRFEPRILPRAPGLEDALGVLDLQRVSDGRGHAHIHHLLRDVPRGRLRGDLRRLDAITRACAQLPIQLLSPIALDSRATSRRVPTVKRRRTSHRGSTVRR